MKYFVSVLDSIVIGCAVYFGTSQNTWLALAAATFSLALLLKLDSITDKE